MSFLHGQLKQSMRTDIIIPGVAIAGDHHSWNGDVSSHESFLQGICTYWVRWSQFLEVLGMVITISGIVMLVRMDRFNWPCWSNCSHSAVKQSMRTDITIPGMGISVRMDCFNCKSLHGCVSDGLCANTFIRTKFVTDDCAQIHLLGQNLPQTMWHQYIAQGGDVFARNRPGWGSNVKSIRID